MHMADALLSPAVGGAMWAVSAGAIAFSSQKVRKELDDRKVPLMGVLGAFLFAAQMINFTIPATGSSGHLGGGLLLTILLGPHAAFLTIASVLVVQALFFADGGLLALGCNIFNMGFIPAFIVYPLIHKRIVGNEPSQARLAAATMLSAIIGLQLGPFGVVLETLFSGISSLPFSTFVLLMQPIHLAIGIIEGVVTVAVVSFVFKARPEILKGALEARPIGGQPVRNVVLTFLVAAFLAGGVVSWYASKNPDGLEWAITKVTGKADLEGSKQGLHGALAALQEATAFLPDYSFKKSAEPKEAAMPAGELKKDQARPQGEQKKDDGSKLGTSVSGLLGSLMVLVLAFLCGFLLKKRGQAV
ncbi:MAG TPA: energy-coupling factor ABC transporter permease [Desulfuromonadaceae bacterium]